MEKLSNLLVRLRSSLWLLPALMIAGAAGLAWLMLLSDQRIEMARDDRPWWLFGGDAEAGRELLAALLSGMITMTSLVVSITMVVLSLAAGQLGPRLIGNFLRDRQIQLVLGLFMGTILYMIIVLRSITQPDPPHAAITLASTLATICLLALLLYVHKLARSIIADTVIMSIADELEQAIARCPPRDAPHAMEPLVKRRRAMTASLGKSGFVQVVDFGDLVDLACEHDLLVRVDVRAGHFVLDGGHHFEVHADAAIDDPLLGRLRKAFVIGSDRTPTQDLEFSIRQLVEIALRALSTGINDPHTAVNVVNRLGAAVEKARGRLPRETRHADAAGTLRVVAIASDFEGFVDASFNEIRQASAGNAALLIHLAKTLGHLALTIDDPPERAHLLKHLAKLERCARRTLDEPADLADFNRTARRARRQLARQQL